MALPPPPPPPTPQSPSDPAASPPQQLPPIVAIVMGSRSDLPTMQHAADTLAQLAIPCESRIVSAHRTPLWMAEYAQSAQLRGIRIIIAGAGGAAHLPGMIASLTPLPVFGVPIQSHALNGIDSLLSIVQMPAGVPVGTLAIGAPGAVNAALLAARCLALHDPALAQRLADRTNTATQSVLQDPLR